jgi:gp16 family phage-associated protein
MTKESLQMNALVIKAEFASRGETISEWAKDRGYNPRTVYAVIQGQLKCHRGLSHKIAVDLGLKTKIGKAETA